MKSIPLDANLVQQLVEAFHDYNHPGAFVVGQSQSAKTASVGSIIEEQIAQGRSVTVLDPHDQLRIRLRDFVLTLRRARRNDLNVVAPADGLHMSVNPLAWTEPSEIPAAVSETRLMIKQAFGDSILNETQPNIDFWMDLALEATALLRCPLTLAPDFLDRSVPHHVELVATLLGIDQTLCAKLAMISEMKIQEYINVVGPGLKRLETVLKKNPYTRDLLSNIDSADASHLIRPGAINLISLKLTNGRTKKQVLRKEDRRFFACLYAKAIYRAIYARDEKDRTHDHTVWLDELSVFEAIFSDIEIGMREAAKFRLKVGGIIQDTTALEGQQESPLLRVFLNNAHFQFFFRTQGVDNQLFSTLPHILTWHPRKVRHVQERTEQYLVGHKIAVVRNKHHDWGEGEQTGSCEDVGEDVTTNEHEEEGTTKTDQKSRGKRRSRNSVHTDSSQTLHSPDHPTPERKGVGASNASGESEDESEQTGTSLGKSRTRGRGISRSKKKGSGRNRGTSRQKSGGIGFSETLIPEHRFRKVIQSIELLSEGQHQLGLQQVLASIPTGQCISVVSGLGVVHLIFPMPVNHGSLSPRYIENEKVKFMRELVKRKIFLDPESIHAQYDRLLAKVHQDLLALRKSDPPKVLTSTKESPENDEPDSNPHMTF